MADMYFENLPNTTTPLHKDNLNKLNDVKVSPTEPTTGEKVWIKKGKNLIKGFTPGLFYNYVNHTYETGTTFSTSEFVDVVVGETYIFSHAINGVGGYIACFDENGNFLEPINNDTVLTPFTITNVNCKKILCISYDPGGNPSQNETWMQLEANSQATAYEPYIPEQMYVKNNNNMYEKFFSLIENITNSNGTAIKYSDGTMICYGSFNVNKPWDTWGSIYAIDATNVATFAQEFYATPVISVTSQNATAACWVATVGVSKTAITKVTCVRPTSYSQPPGSFTYIAIGRWKA